MSADLNSNHKRRLLVALAPVLNEALAKLEAATRRRPESPTLVETILDAATTEMVDEWRGSGASQANAASKIAACGQDHVRHLVDEVANSLARLREDLTHALRTAAQAAGASQEDTTDIPAPAGLPILDLEACLPDVTLPRPRLARLLKARASRVTRARLAGELGPQLARLLAQYVKQLAEWRSDILLQMRRSFTAKADLYRAQCGQRRESSDRTAMQDDLKRLQVLQRDGLPPRNQ